MFFVSKSDMEIRKNEVTKAIVNDEPELLFAPFKEVDFLLLLLF